MKRTLTGTLLAAAALAALLGTTGCLGETPGRPSTPVGAKTESEPCPDNVCAARPQAVQPVSNAVQSELDPTRETILNEIRTQRADQMLDHTYLTASGIGLNQRPKTWSDELADRTKHEECLTTEWNVLWDGTAPEADETTISGTRHERAIALDECFAGANGDWTTAVPSERAQWIGRILEAARRATSPADALKPYIRNEREDQEWTRLAAAFEGCAGVAAALADNAALTGGGQETATATLLAIRETVTCNEKAADLAYPQELTGPGRDGYGQRDGYEGPAESP